MSGCSSTTSNGPVPQQQGYNVTGGAALQYNQAAGGRQTGQPLQMGNTIGIANTGWPGAASDSDTGISLLNVRNPVIRGENGGLTVRGVPNTDYTVTATYDTSRGTMRASAAGRSGEDGRLSWTWNVKRDTFPGTYRLVVTGAGKMITTTYTVQ